MVRIFELTLLGYQYPKLEHQKYDANWLQIGIRVKLPAGEWSASGPILLTYEVSELAKWLQDWAVGQNDKIRISFIEPNLFFKVVNSGPESLLMRIYLEQQFRPPWNPARYVIGQDDESYRIELRLTQDNLKEAAESLEAELSRFPYRQGK